jgi:hypothetical protein
VSIEVRRLAAACAIFAAPLVAIVFVLERASSGSLFYKGHFSWALWITPYIIAAFLIFVRKRKLRIGAAMVLLLFEYSMLELLFAV